MNTHHDPQPSRSLEPFVDLRTIPSGWDLSEFYSPADHWVNEPQDYREAPRTRSDSTWTPYDAAEDAV